MWNRDLYLYFGIVSVPVPQKFYLNKPLKFSALLFFLMADPVFLLRGATPLGQQPYILLIPPRPPKKNIMKSKKNLDPYGEGVPPANLDQQLLFLLLFLHQHLQLKYLTTLIFYTKFTNNSTELRFILW